MKLRNQLLILMALVCCATTNLHAAYTVKQGRLVNVDETVTFSVQKHYSLGEDAIEEKNWREAARQFNIVSKNFPNTEYGQEAFYYLGVAEFNLQEYDAANEAFSHYLKVHNNPKFFQNTIEYKYSIAEMFKGGAKRRFLGTKRLPKWASGTSLALNIYDEVIAAMPCHDMAAQALYSKGCLLWEMRDYKASVEAFQVIIRRFPKHEMAPQCYVIISKVYIDQSKNEFQNPDILAFAEINSRKFSRDFPKDERLAEVENDVLAIKEVYAHGLYATGRFYERKNKPKASLIYYQNAIDQFPETNVAKRCKKRLEDLHPEAEKKPSTIIGEDFNLEDTERHS